MISMPDFKFWVTHPWRIEATARTERFLRWPGSAVESWTWELILSPLNPFSQTHPFRHALSCINSLHKRTYKNMCAQIGYLHDFFPTYLHGGIFHLNSAQLERWKHHKILLFWKRSHGSSNYSLLHLQIWTDCAAMHWGTAVQYNPPISTAFTAGITTHCPP